MCGANQHRQPNPDPSATRFGHMELLNFCSVRMLSSLFLRKAEFINIIHLLKGTRRKLRIGAVTIQRLL